MTQEFFVRTTSHFDRTFRKLAKKHRELVGAFATILQILKSDPYNLTRSHSIKKLEGIKPGDAEYRIRVGRWRFRYDIVDRIVYLKACSLRREDTY
jgi:mRNA-degrading endonuclease RelE of RelBE toxin-antitoxin system